MSATEIPPQETRQPAIRPPDSDHAVQGLACPRCGGMVTIPEGQAVVICPYCTLPSAISAENDPGWEDDGNPGVGVRRYQAPLQVSRQAAQQAFRAFLSSNLSIARNCAKQAQLTEAFLMHLPFWVVWGRGVAWAFGQQEVGSGDNKRFEPREKQYVRELTWNSPACDVGEFGVRQISLGESTLDVFQPEALHGSGMVFEPVGSAREALDAARRDFEAQLSKEVKLSRTAQLFTRVVRPRMGLVYYPMWVMRYLYKGRAFQVVVDGCDGQVLYGKAPTSVTFRAGAMVAGMAAGALISIDLTALLLFFTGTADDSDGLLGGALLALVFGLGLMWTSYRRYRNGELYEFQRYKRKDGDAGVEKTLSNLKLAIEKGAVPK